MCGLVWLDPMPLEEDIGKAYERYHTHTEETATPNGRFHRTYALVKEAYLTQQYGNLERSQPIWKEALCLLLWLLPSRRAEVDAEVFYLSRRNKGRLLDVGCGSGLALDRMAELGWQVEGLEPDPAAVEVARSKGLEVRQGTLYTQHFAPEYFDVVVVNHVIEHVHDPFLLMKECYRVLRPGGRLIVITPNIKSWGQRMYKYDWRGLEAPRHLHIFTLSSLVAMFALAGFASAWSHLDHDAGEEIILISAK